MGQLGERGITVNDEKLLDYDEFDYCNLCVSIQDDKIDNKNLDKDCCIEFESNSQTGNFIS